MLVFEVNMTPEEFKALYTRDFSTFSITTLDHYIIEGRKIIAQMKQIDPIVVEIVARLEECKLSSRG